MEGLKSPGLTEVWLNLQARFDTAALPGIPPLDEEEKEEEDEREEDEEEDDDIDEDLKELAEDLGVDPEELE